MNREHAAYITVVTGVVSVTAGILHAFGMVPLWVYAAVLVLAFPVFVVCLYLWWMAKEGEGDIPFIGY